MFLALTRAHRRLLTAKMPSSAALVSSCSPPGQRALGVLRSFDSVFLVVFTLFRFGNATFGAAAWTVLEPSTATQVVYVLEDVFCLLWIPLVAWMFLAPARLDAAAVAQGRVTLRAVYALSVFYVIHVVWVLVPWIVTATNEPTCLQWRVWHIWNVTLGACLWVRAFLVASVGLMKQMFHPENETMFAEPVSSLSARTRPVVPPSSAGPPPAPPLRFLPASSATASRTALQRRRKRRQEQRCVPRPALVAAAAARHDE